jgi:hypothetical protein
VNDLRSVLGKLDVSVLEWMHGHATPTGMAICIAISHLGSATAMTLLGLAGALLLATLEEWIVLGGWIAASWVAQKPGASDSTQWVNA